MNKRVTELITEIKSKYAVINDIRKYIKKIRDDKTICQLTFYESGVRKFINLTDAERREIANRLNKELSKELEASVRLSKELNEILYAEYNETKYGDIT